MVKAGNSEGTSQLTAPVKFYTVRHWSLIADQVTMIHYSRLTNSSSPAPPGTRTSGAQWASCSPSSSSSVSCLNQFCTPVQYSAVQNWCTGHFINYLSHHVLNSLFCSFGGCGCLLPEEEEPDPAVRQAAGRDLRVLREPLLHLLQGQLQRSPGQ